ncbi:15-hydroxyprostaglandin dehydrogenase [NAD(+)]-like [Ischnura elegans]|uniref:15-hydroxyprostaglandin dehydrogenase [NAD(+)]-like n=1 Tax=Ischnura elegans TaxID=197161 RepID=UPI001ED8A70B|nr:15-hydroxyprostaglandin dehydrogenase [NAD(+)]-like [Ischnura elegans]
MMQPLKQFSPRLLQYSRNLLQGCIKHPQLTRYKSSHSVIPKNQLNFFKRSLSYASPRAITLPTKRDGLSSRAYTTTTEQLMDPKCKVAIVTGGATGTGYSITKKLLCCGVKVLIVDIDGQAGQKAAHILGEQFGQGSVLFYHGDVSCEGHIHAFFRKCFDHFGGVNILINHASVMDACNWVGECDINLGAVAKCMEISFNHLSCDVGVPGGFILNMSSTFALKPFPVHPTYCATRRGVHGLHESYLDPFYYRLRNIRIALLCAGPSNTCKIEKGRSHLPTRELQEEYDRVMVYECKQNPDAVGAAVANMVCHAPHGSMWVVEDGELFMIQYPCYKNCRIESSVRQLLD